MFTYTTKALKYKILMFCLFLALNLPILKNIKQSITQESICIIEIFIRVSPIF